MNRRERSAILAAAASDEVKRIAQAIQERHDIQILKEPQKTLVMVKVRESVQGALFYLGEVLATESMVVVDGAKGASVVAGDDFEKCMALAVIDGYFNLPEAEGKDVIEQEIIKLKTAQKQAREAINRELRRSQVNFNVMGE